MNAARVRRVTKPKNGRYWVALVVGIKWELAQLLKPALATAGVYLKHTWLLHELRGMARRELPSDIDCVCVLTEPSIGRNDRETVLHRAREACYGFAVQPQIQPILRAFESNGFSGSMLFIDDIEAPPPTKPEPSLLARTLMAEADIDDEELEKLTRPTTTPTPEPKPENAIRPMPEQSKQPAKGDPRLVEEGKKLKEMREGLGLKLSAVSRVVGVSGGHIGMIEQGKHVASGAVLTALERLYGLPNGTIKRYSTRQNNTKIREAAEREAKAAAALQAQAAPEAVLPSVEPRGFERADIGEWPTGLLTASPDHLRGPVLVEAPPVVAPTLPVVSVAPADPLSGLSAADALLLRVARIQGELLTLGIASITITPGGLSITRSVD